MSTTFGILIKGEPFELVNDSIPLELYEDEYWRDNFKKLAYRYNNGKINWINEYVRFLPDDTRVYPLDNTAQGIFTIGDIKKEMKEYGNTNK